MAAGSESNEAATPGWETGRKIPKKRGNKPPSNTKNKLTNKKDI